MKPEGLYESEGVPLTGHGGLYGCKTSRIHFLGSRLTDGGEVVSLTLPLRYTHQEHSWYSFLLVAEPNQGP
jgi:hypothetical protein